MQRIKKLFRPAIMIGSIGVSAFSGWQLSTSAGGSMFIERSQSELQERLVKVAARYSDQATLEEAINSELASEPRNWVVINSLWEIAKNREVPLSAEVLESLENADSSDNAFPNTAKECVVCAWDTTSCQASTAISCGLMVNIIIPIGDIAGIKRAGTAYWAGEEFDQIDAALSVIGLSATAVTLGSWGASSPVSVPLKMGASSLKLAHLSGSIPSPISRVLATAAREGIDWPRLRAVRGAGDLKSVMRVDALMPATNAATSLGKIVNRSGVAPGLHLLRISEDVSDLRSISRVSDVWQDETAGFLKLVGKNRVVRTTLRLADEVYLFALGLVGLLTSLFWTMISLVANRAAKRVSSWFSA